MPLPLETQMIMPNAVYAPQIVLSSFFDNGRLVTSASVTIKGGRVDEKGNWSEAASDAKTVYVADVENPEADIACILPQVGILAATIVDIIGTINSIRKVL